MVEPVHLIPQSERELALKRAHYNLFNLTSEEIFIDLLTDSGTGAMSHNQWASMMQADESYANAKSFTRFKEVIEMSTGMGEILPTHQGRAAENILFGHLLKDKKQAMVVSNQSFDTTIGHILYNEAIPVDIVIEEGKSPSFIHPFKGNMNIQKLEDVLLSNSDQVEIITLVVTNNAGGGQPVSMDNIKKVSEIAKKYNKYFFLDIARGIENAYFIQEREAEYQNYSLSEIFRKMCGYADGVWMSAKKDAYVNIGGFIALHDSELANKLRERLILFEGFPSYGGLAGRDLEAIATGLEEALTTDTVKQRINQVDYLVNELDAIGIPVVLPSGGHAAFIDAKEFLPHIPVEEFPAQALSCELYLRGGIRSVEIGSLMFGTHENGKFIPASNELLRLTIPRRTYEKGHLDYIVSIFKEIIPIKSSLQGLKITEEPELLRHFSCKLDLSNSELKIKSL